jgi:hypothetical protein
VSGAGKVYVYSTVSPGRRPGRPIRVAAEAVSPTEIALAWDGNGAGESGFVIEVRRPAQPWVAATLAAPAGPGARLARVIGLQSGRSYFLRVKATTPSGDSAWSPEVAAATPP